MIELTIKDLEKYPKLSTHALNEMRRYRGYADKKAKIILAFVWDDAHFWSEVSAGNFKEAKKMKPELF